MNDRTIITTATEQKTWCEKVSAVDTLKTSNESMLQAFWYEWVIV